MTHDALDRERAVGSLKSGLGDVHAALHYENVALCVFFVAAVSGYVAAFTLFDGDKTERAMASLGAVAAIGVPMWVWLS